MPGVVQIIALLMALALGVVSIMRGTDSSNSSTVAAMGTTAGATRDSLSSMNTVAEVLRVLEAAAASGRLSRTSLDPAGAYANVLPGTPVDGTKWSDFRFNELAGAAGSVAMGEAPALGGPGGSATFGSTATRVATPSALRTASLDLPMPVLGCDQLSALGASSALCASQGPRMYLIVALDMPPSQATPLISMFLKTSGAEEIQMLDPNNAAVKAALPLHAAKVLGTGGVVKGSLLLVRSVVRTAA